MKIVGFVGSPRKSGNTSAVVNRILEGASEAGAQVKIYYLGEMDLKSCKGCLYCREHEGCVINDDMQEVYKDIKDADGLVIGTPIFICQVSGLLKLMLDRFYPLTSKFHRPRYGIKTVVTVYTQAAPLPLFFKMYMNYTEKNLKAMGLHIVKRIIGTRCFKADIMKNNKKLMDKAFRVGQKLGSGLLCDKKQNFIVRLIRRIKRVFVPAKMQGVYKLHKK